MSLDATRLATALQAAHVAAGATPGPELTTLCAQVAAAIITEIVANAVVPAATIIAPAGGGPCTGGSTVT